MYWIIKGNEQSQEQKLELAGASEPLNTHKKSITVCFCFPSWHLYTCSCKWNTHQTLSCFCYILPASQLKRGSTKLAFLVIFSLISPQFPVSHTHLTFPCPKICSWAGQGGFRTGRSRDVPVVLGTPSLGCAAERGRDLGLKEKSLFPWQ